MYFIIIKLINMNGIGDYGGIMQKQKLYPPFK